jgi:hypothetical protein
VLGPLWDKMMAYGSFENQAGVMAHRPPIFKPSKHVWSILRTKPCRRGSISASSGVRGFQHIAQTSSTPRSNLRFSTNLESAHDIHHPSLIACEAFLSTRFVQRTLNVILEL